MRLASLGITLLIFLGGSVRAQDIDAGADQTNEPALAEADRLPVRTVNTAVTLRDEWKIRYILRQLDISKDKASELEKLATDTMIASKKPLPMQLIDVGMQLQEAQREENEARAAELRDVIADMMNQPFRDAIDAIRPMLDGENSKRLDRALARLDEVPSGALRPADAFNIAMAQGLTPEQEMQIDLQRSEFRSRWARNGPRFDTDDQRRAEALSRFCVALRETLPADKRAAFWADLQRLRVDMVPGIRDLDAQVIPDDSRPRMRGGRTTPAGQTGVIQED